MTDITVGIPFHEAITSEQLKTAIDSILDQTVMPDKIQLLQDGNISDELKNTVESYLDIERVEFHNFDENIGLTKLLNYSIEKTETTYYARMDADDISVPERFERQLNLFEDNPNLDIVGTWAEDIDKNEERVALRKVPIEHDEIVKYIWTNPMLHPSVMFKKASIEQVGMYNDDLRKRQDYDLWFRCANEGLRFQNIGEPLLKYRFTEDWFEKNDTEVIWNQVRIGWKGCKLVGASPIAYLGVMFPLIKVLFPKKIGVGLSKMVKRIDPRN